MRASYGSHSEEEGRAFVERSSSIYYGHAPSTRRVVLGASFALLGAAAATAAFVAFADLQPYPPTEAATMELQQVRETLVESLALAISLDETSEFDVLDADGDGVVTKDEYLDRLNARRADVLAKLEQSNVADDIKQPIATMIRDDFDDEAACVANVFDMSGGHVVDKTTFEFVYPLIDSLCKKPQASGLVGPVGDGGEGGEGATAPPQLGINGNVNQPEGSDTQMGIDGVPTGDDVGIDGVPTEDDVGIDGAPTEDDAGIDGVPTGDDDVGVDGVPTENDVGINGAATGDDVGVDGVPTGDDVGIDGAPNDGNVSIDGDVLPPSVESTEANETEEPSDDEVPSTSEEDAPEENDENVPSGIPPGSEEPEDATATGLDDTTSTSTSETTYPDEYDATETGEDPDTRDGETGDGDVNASGDDSNTPSDKAAGDNVTTIGDDTDTPDEETGEDDAAPAEDDSATTLGVDEVPSSDETPNGDFGTPDGDLDGDDAALPGEETPVSSDTDDDNTDADERSGDVGDVGEEDEKSSGEMTPSDTVDESSPSVVTPPTGTDEDADDEDDANFPQSETENADSTGDVEPSSDTTASDINSTPDQEYGATNDENETAAVYPEEQMPQEGADSDPRSAHNDQSVYDDLDRTTPATGTEGAEDTTVSGGVDLRDSTKAWPTAPLSQYPCTKNPTETPSSSETDTTANNLTHTHFGESNASNDDRASLRKVLNGLRPSEHDGDSSAPHKKSADRFAFEKALTEALKDLAVREERLAYADLMVKKSSFLFGLLQECVTHAGRLFELKRLYSRDQAVEWVMNECLEFRDVFEQKQTNQP